MVITDPEEMIAIKAAKAACRKKITEIVEKKTLQECLEQSKKIQQKLFSTPEWKNSKRISIYLSMEKEVSTDEIAKTALKDGKTCFIPICIKNDMFMLRLKDLNDLNTLPRNSWGIREPKPIEGREDAMKTGGVDFVVTPGVAFTLEGHRLGHGRGYYDRFFQSLRQLRQSCNEPPPFAFALAFKEQILPSIPVSDNDVMIDRIITPD